jgi:phage terminase large subunit-like protein
VFTAAVDKEQAGIAFRDAVSMIHKAPALERRLTFSGGVGREFNVADIATGSYLRPLSSDSKGKGKSGFRVHCAVLDEVHEHPTDAMIEFVRANTKARRQPMVIMITNSGASRNSVAWRYHEYSEKIVNGILRDDEFFGYVCGLDDNDEWTDEKVWPKANPLLQQPEGVAPLPGYGYLRQQVREARGMPAKQGVVRRLNFCQWTETESAWLTAEVWDAAEADLRLSDHEGREAVIGFDLSQGRNAGRGDPTALCLLFRLDDGARHAFVRCYLPAEGLVDRTERQGAPYAYWRDAGFLTTTPGRFVDQSVVAADIADWCARFRVTALVGDEYRARDLNAALTELGVQVPRVWHPQGHRARSKSGLYMPASLDLTEKLLVNGTLKIERNAMFRWMAAATAIRTDRENNRAPAKDEAERRGAHIDGVVALIEAVGLMHGDAIPPAVQLDEPAAVWV